MIRHRSYFGFVENNRRLETSVPMHARVFHMIEMNTEELRSILHPLETKREKLTLAFLFSQCGLFTVIFSFSQWEDD